MKEYSSSNIRNIVLLGHGGAGKTALSEALLYNTGQIDRMGSIDKGTTVSDFDKEEIARNFSINMSLIPVEWNDYKINILDTPGYFDFLGEVIEGVRVADSAIIVVSAHSGVEVGTEKAFKKAQEANLSKMFFINRMDEENVDFDKILADMKEEFGIGVTAFQYPIYEDNKFVGIIDVLKEKARMIKGSDLVDAPIPDSYKDKVDELNNSINEAIAETDEELMEKFFAEEPFTEDDIIKGIKTGIASGDLFPVFLGSATSNFAIKRLADDIIHYLPSPIEKGSVTANVNGEDKSIECGKENKFSGFVFKTIADPFVGKISFFRVYSGSLDNSLEIINTKEKETEKTNHIYTMRGKKQIEVQKLNCGDIGALTKLQYTETGDTIAEKGFDIKYPGLDFPEPVVSYAVEAADKGDEDKIGTGLARLREEDPTFVVEVVNETHETLIKGTGEQHIRIITSKLEDKYGVKVELNLPKVPYRETIKKKVKAEGKHKKQSGGHGQYGHVFIEFEPGETEELTFEEKIFGGSVPKNYFPAVEKGLRESMKEGVFAKYPVVFLKATLVDGSFHPVDSSEMAFKVAASKAFRSGLKDAKPVLLEPIQRVEITVTDEHMGDILGDLNKRRGKVQGMEPQKDGTEKIIAEVPFAEMFTYAPDLKSMTQGRATFTSEFAKYEQVPTEIAQKIKEERESKEED